MWRWWGGGCAEAFRADEVELGVGLACGVEPAMSERGGGDDERSCADRVCDGEGDVGLAESGGIGEEGTSEVIEAREEPGDCCALVWQQRDVTDGKWWCGEVECAGFQCGACEAVDRVVCRCHDARVSDSGPARSVSAVQARSGATSAWSMA